MPRLARDLAPRRGWSFPLLLPDGQRLGFASSGKLYRIYSKDDQLTTCTSYYEDREDIADWSMQKMRMTRIAVRNEESPSRRPVAHHDRLLAARLPVDHRVRRRRKLEQLHGRTHGRPAD